MRSDAMKQKNIVIISHKQKSTPALENKRQMAEKIAAQTAAFLSSGQEIIEVDQGVSGHPNAGMPYKDWAQQQRYGKSKGAERPQQRKTAKALVASGNWAAYMTEQER